MTETQMRLGLTHIVREDAFMHTNSELVNTVGNATLISPKVYPWDSGPAVIELQELLRAHGFNLRVDGEFGSLTEKAVATYQRQQGLRVDGVVGAKTWAALKTTVKPGTRRLSIGRTGADVRYLQGLLQIQGYNVPWNGNFGASTQQAVMAFQERHKLKSTGLVDPTTWTVLQGNPPLPIPAKQTRWTFDFRKWR
jgi:peptidoglycan hydrolase-like protein with peptidoglycan-binding domain